jgi:hypothetical protein
MLPRHLFTQLASTALVAATLATPGVARAASMTLDWEDVATSGEWQDQQTETQNLAIGNGTVNVGFDVGADTQFATFSGRKTPEVNDVLNGTNPDDDRSLHLQMDTRANGQGGDNKITMNVGFDGYGGAVTEVGFWLYDIDVDYGSWQDRVQITGYSGAQIVDPVFQLLYAETQTLIQIGTDTLEGRDWVHNDQDKSNVYVSFLTAIDRFSLIFSDGEEVQSANLSSHGIGVGDIAFSTATVPADVPEPTGLGALGLMSVMGAGAIRRKQRRSAS